MFATCMRLPNPRIEIAVGACRVQTPACRRAPRPPQRQAGFVHSPPWRSRFFHGRPQAPVVVVQPIPDSPGRSAKIICLGGASLSGVVKLLGVRVPSPVLVIVGGAHNLEDTDSELVRLALDRALAPAISAVSAIVLTGGTHSGVMRLAGEILGKRDIQLIGVAPEACVSNWGPGIGRPAEGLEETALDPNHQLFVLTNGESWGSETETLFALAEAITGDATTGTVVVANGGAVARHEAKRFLLAGWAVMPMVGTGRAADDLARIARAPTLGIRRRHARDRKQLQIEWGDLSDARIDSHDLKDEPIELLERRLAWHLSNQRLLKNAYATWASYESAATREKDNTRRAQYILAILAGSLTGGSLLYGAYLQSSDALRSILVAIPLLLSFGSTLTDFVLPRRNWLILRAAAESTQRSLYTYRAQSSAGMTVKADNRLIQELAAVRHGVLRSGVSALLPQMVGRPATLSDGDDELGPLTLRSYSTLRLEGQLKYYKNAAKRLRRYQLLTIGTIALIAAAATAAATEANFALWVPLLILAASTLTILQQRARWQDRIVGYTSALADLQAIRDQEYATGRHRSISALVSAVEGVLQRENSSWSQHLRASSADAEMYRHFQLDG
jgi:predicted Rossmann-fold nucleotide-binding protein